MKVIHLFLASSIDEFKHERNELKAYIGTLNDHYAERGLYFQLTLCEDLSNALAHQRKQDEYNDKIRNSQFVYILLGMRAGDYTIEEFNVALEQYRKTETPKIYTYFRELPEGTSPEQSVLDFITRLDKELGHFYSTFSNIDSIKLNVLLELVRSTEVGDIITFEDGQAKLNGKPMLNLEHVPIYAKNKVFQQMKQELETLNEEYTALCEKSIDGETGNAVLQRRAKVADKRSELLKQIHAIENEILNLCTTIAERNRSEKALTWREKKASDFLDVGEFEAALNILRDEEREQELKQAEAVIENGLDRIRGYISENRLRISALQAQGVTEKTLPELLCVFEKNCELAEKYRIEMTVFYGYANFLFKQRQYQKGIDIAEKLHDYYMTNEAEEVEKGKLLNLLGLLYCNQHLFKNAETYHRQALAIRRRLAEHNPAAYEPDVAMTCNNLALLLENIHKYIEAEDLYQEALAIYRRLAEHNPAAYEPDVAMTCNNLALLLENIHKYIEAEDLYQEALAIYRRLAEHNPVAYEPDVAMTCNNLAILLSDIGKYSEAEGLYREALAIYRRLAEHNPAAYESDVAMTCNNLAILLKNVGEFTEAEGLYREALAIYRRLAEHNPTAYEPDVAMTCNNLASLLKNVGELTEAEDLYREALAIRRQLAVHNPRAYELNVATTCNNLANLLKNLGNYTEAEDLYWEALAIYERYSQYKDRAENIKNILKPINIVGKLSSSIWHFFQNFKK